jgi:hypothetical protein
MNCQAFTNDSLTMLYEAIRGALAADDGLKRQGLASHSAFGRRPTGKSTPLISSRKCSSVECVSMSSIGQKISRRVGPIDSQIESCVDSITQKAALACFNPQWPSLISRCRYAQTAWPALERQNSGAVFNRRIFGMTAGFPHGPSETTDLFRVRGASVFGATSRRQGKAHIPVF